jgi:hypothetical protein
MQTLYTNTDAAYKHRRCIQTQTLYTCTDAVYKHRRCIQTQTLYIHAQTLYTNTDAVYKHRRCIQTQTLIGTRRCATWKGHNWRAHPSLTFLTFLLCLQREPFNKNNKMVNGASREASAYRRLSAPFSPASQPQHNHRAASR